MSGIARVFQFDGAPVEPETIQRMLNALDCGPDSKGICQIVKNDLT